MTPRTFLSLKKKNNFDYFCRNGSMKRKSHPLIFRTLPFDYPLDLDFSLRSLKYAIALQSQHKFQRERDIILRQTPEAT